MSPNTETALRDAENRESKWLDYNVELFRRIFSTDSYSRRYETLQSRIDGDFSFNERVSYFKERVQECLTQLESDFQKLPIIPEAPSHSSRERWEKIAAFVFGVFFIVVLLSLAIFIPHPSDFQIFTFRVTLALAAAGIGAVVPGFISVKAGPYVRAGGAIALFVLLFWFNPPKLVTNGPVPQTAEELLSTVENVNEVPEKRLSALLRLRDSLGWRDFRKRNLSGLSLPTSGWSGSEFVEADLRKVNLRGANLQGLKFWRTDFTDADLSNADLRGAELNGSVMVKCICVGTKFDEAQLRAGTYRLADFRNASFRYAKLTFADFTSANFSGAVLERADFNEGQDSRSNISNALFRSAVMPGADFRNTIGFRSADFRGAEYNGDTSFPSNFNPQTAGLLLR